MTTTSNRLITFAKQLRHNSTDAERLLWSRLRTHRLNGYKFKRQAPLGPYIVDFACFEEKLVVELDGGQHAEAAGKDRQRDRWLEEQGFRVLRFWNNEVFGNLEGVLTRILEALSPSQLPSSPSPQPLSHQGRGALTPSPSMGEGWGEGKRCQREDESDVEGATP